MKPDRETASFLAEVLASEPDFASEHCDFTVGDHERGGPEGVAEPESPKGYGGADIHRSRRPRTEHKAVVMALQEPHTAPPKRRWKSRPTPAPHTDAHLGTPSTPLLSDAPPTSPLSDAPPTSPHSDTPPTPLLSDAPPTSPLSDAPPTPLLSDAPPTSPLSDTPPTPAAPDPTEPASDLESTAALEPAAIPEPEPDFATEHRHMTVSGSDAYRTRRH